MDSSKRKTKKKKLKKQKPYKEDPIEEYGTDEEEQAMDQKNIEPSRDTIDSRKQFKVLFVEQDLPSVIAVANKNVEAIPAPPPSLPPKRRKEKEEMEQVALLAPPTLENEIYTLRDESVPFRMQIVNAAMRKFGFTTKIDDPNFLKTVSQGKNSQFPVPAWSSSFLNGWFEIRPKDPFHSASTHFLPNVIFRGSTTYFQDPELPIVEEVHPPALTRPIPPLSRRAFEEEHLYEPPHGSNWPLCYRQVCRGVASAQKFGKEGVRLRSYYMEHELEAVKSNIRELPQKRPCLLCLRYLIQKQLLTNQSENRPVKNNCSLQLFYNGCGIPGEYLLTDCTTSSYKHYDGLMAPIVSHSDDKVEFHTSAQGLRGYRQKYGYPSVDPEPLYLCQEARHYLITQMVPQVESQ